MIATRSEIFPRAQVIAFQALASPRWHATRGGSAGRCDRAQKSVKSRNSDTPTKPSPNTPATAS
jgi:hypothetical protein